MVVSLFLRLVIGGKVSDQNMAAGAAVSCAEHDSTNATKVERVTQYSKRSGLSLRCEEVSMSAHMRYIPPHISGVCIASTNGALCFKRASF